MHPRESSERPRDSGATGGSATGAGVKYQVDFATNFALDLIARLLRETPTARQNLVIEPREVFEDSITRWDIRVSPDPEVFEAKLKPSKRDLEEWLARVAEGFAQNATAKFCLVYGDLPGAFLRAIEALLRVSAEAGEDRDRFELFVRSEQLVHASDIIARLGNDAFATLRQMSTWPISERSLENQILSKLRYMVRAGDSSRLRDALTSRFLAAMKPRLAFNVPQLLRELESSGFHFYRPAAVEANELPEVAKTALFALQRCPKPLPTQVLADTCGVTVPNFINAVADYGHVLHESGGVWTHTPLAVETDHRDAPLVLGRAITGLLNYLRSEPNGPGVADQFTNVIALAYQCKDANPTAAISVFEPVEKALKRAGRKRDVLKLAQFTVDLARTIIPRDGAVVEKEALALICGVSWTHQRIGDLEAAERIATESQELGESIGYVRNTAFCKKCLGRLKRVQAEREFNLDKRSKLMNMSIRLLKEAIEIFGNHEKYGPRHDEVGDCNSLLGRTYFVAKRLDQAEAHAAEARRIFTRCTSKHYMDLLLLEGELASAKYQYDVADRKFKEVLELAGEHDAERSEIAARAHLCRGLNLHEWKRPDGELEMAIAGRIWRGLGEHYNAGLADWLTAKIAKRVPSLVESRTKTLPPSLRVEILRRYEEYVNVANSRALAQRSELSDAAWEEIVRVARETDAIQNRRW